MGYGPVGSNAEHDNVTPIVNRPVGVADFVNPAVIPSDPILGAPGTTVPDAWKQQGPPEWPQFAPGENIMTAPTVKVPAAPWQGPPYVAPTTPRTDVDFWGQMVPATLPSGSGARTADPDQAGTGFGPSYTGAFPDVDVAGSIADHARMYYETAYGQVDAEFDKTLGRLNEDYGDQIGQLQEIMDDYKQGRIDADTAYDAYQETSAAILQAAITVPADPIQSAVEDAVQEGYSRAGGALGEVASLIDAGGDPARFGQAMGEITAFQDAMVEGLRHDLISIEEVHHASAEVARALAKSAYADDQYRSEYAQEELNIQITSAIDAQADQIAQAKAAWEKAKRRMAEDRADAANNVADYEIDEDYFRGIMWDEWVAGMNLDPEQSAAVRAKGVEAWAASGGNIAEYNKEITQVVNEYNLGTKGVLGDWTSLAELVGSASGGKDPLMETEMMNLLRTRSFADSYGDFVSMAANAFGVVLANSEGDPYPGFWDHRDRVIRSLAVTGDDPLWFNNDPIVQALKNYSTFESDFSTEMQAERERQAAAARAKYHTGSQAPNNAARQDEPDYVYRRETLAPWVADMFKSEFSGGKVGGLGYIRPPGRGAKNSDHQSGGALDLYGANEQQRVAIAAWARSQPWASMVIYEGDSDHEGHHVHVSLQIGYRI